MSNFSFSQDPRFMHAIKRVLNSEGGYSNNPADPGGETKFGISKRSYPHVDIKNLTWEGACQIYYDDFWKPCRLGQFFDSVAFQMLDAAVNHGIGNAVRFLQRAVGVVDDGHWGPLSAAALQKMTTTDVLFRFLAQRLRFMAKLSTFKTFGAGWSNRIADNLDYAAEDA